MDLYIILSVSLTVNLTWQMVSYTEPSGKLLFENGQALPNNMCLGDWTNHFMHHHLLQANFNESDQLQESAPTSGGSW